MMTTTQIILDFDAPRRAIAFRFEAPDQITMLERMQARREQAYRELASNLADMVEAGDLTDTEANIWLADKAEQWFGGDQ